MTLTDSELELTVAPVEEVECTWGSCTQVALYQAIFEAPCEHAALACIKHKDMANRIQNTPEEPGHIYVGWLCPNCNARNGFITRWESVR